MNLSAQTPIGDSSVSIDALPPFYFIVTFWGERYRKLFCRFTLSSLLAPNNIPALRYPAECRFLICTAYEDWAALQSEPSFALLKTYIEPVFLESQVGPPREYKYHRMSRGHEALTSACHQAKACAIYLAPDTLVPDGCVAEAQRLVGAGRRVVLCTAIRFDLDGVETELVSRGILRPGRPLLLSRREAVAVGLHHLHPESRAGNWNAPNFGALSAEHNRTNFPTCCFWEVPGEDGIVIHTHNWAPFAIDFSSLPVHDTHTFKRWAIDGDYIFRNFGQANIGGDVYIVEDSDEIILLGLTPRDEMVPPATTGFFDTFSVLRQWAKGYMLNEVVFDKFTDPLRRKIYPIPVRWHSQDLSLAWAAVESEARNIMKTYARDSLNPKYLFTGHQSLLDRLRLLFSRRILSFAWFGLMSLMLPRPPIFMFRGWALLGSYWALLGSYPGVIWLALRGDPVEKKRIHDRVKTIVSAFVRSR